MKQPSFAKATAGKLTGERGELCYLVPARMREELTRLLRAVPFVPFVLSTRDGESHPVETVERLSVGSNACFYVDLQGYLFILPYHAIDKISLKDVSATH